MFCKERKPKVRDSYVKHEAITLCFLFLLFQSNIDTVLLHRKENDVEVHDLYNVHNNCIAINCFKLLNIV